MLNKRNTLVRSGDDTTTTTTTTSSSRIILFGERKSRIAKSIPKLMLWIPRILRISLLWGIAACLLCGWAIFIWHLDMTTTPPAQQHQHQQQPPKDPHGKRRNPPAAADAAAAVLGNRDTPRHYEPKKHGLAKKQRAMFNHGNPLKNVLSNNLEEYHNETDFWIWIDQVVRQNDPDNTHQQDSTNNNNKHHHHHPQAILNRLPKWIQDYVSWHSEMRRQYPGRLLWEDPQGPKLLLRTCLGLCGGLNDRLGQLPWDLYLANQTKRVLLLHWHRPVSLEHFLIPRCCSSNYNSSYSSCETLSSSSSSSMDNSGILLDWRVPTVIPGFFPKAIGERTTSREDMRLVRNRYRDLFEGYDADAPTELFWRRDFPVALERAIQGSFSKHRVLRHRLLGHLDESVLEERLRDLGETDLIHSTPSFGLIFKLFFQPSFPIQHRLHEIYRTLEIQPHRYSAVHCRVRHPKATPRFVSVKGKIADYTADKVGLPWMGPFRDFAIDMATYALQCAATLHRSSSTSAAVGKQQRTEPIYFFSDSDDLIQYLTHAAAAALPPDDNNHQKNKNESLLSLSWVDQAARQVLRENSFRIITRTGENGTVEENAHIDLQKGRQPWEYYATFLDFFVAVTARCVTHGIGYYAVFATKVSGTDCKLSYQEEAWGGSAAKRKLAPLCTVPRPSRSESIFLSQTHKKKNGK